MMRPALLRRILVLTLVLATVSWRSSAAGKHTDTDRVAASTMVTTATMSVPRMAHTATSLPNGRVLVAGGFTGDEQAAKSAELFDPQSARFLLLPRMVTVRHSHTATVLANGKVLLVGGFGVGNAVLASAELFDPTTSTFASAGAMHAPRAGHVATLLANGTVLVAGGVGPDWTFLSSAELYDPTTGRFSPTSAMTVARESHTAVRLHDGRVLIAGGHRDRRANITLYASAEVYEPTTGRFTRAGDMQVRRHKHDAVLLRDGRVMVTGGSDERDDQGVYSSTELFDPASGTFTLGPSMTRGRYKHQGSSVLLPNGTVLLAGGDVQAETYDPTTRTFALVGGDARMAGQFSAVAPLGDGRVLLTGGYGGGTGPRASAWLYLP